MNIHMLEELSKGALVQVEFCTPTRREFHTEWARSKDASSRFKGLDVAGAIADGLAVMCKSDDRAAHVEITDAGRRALDGLNNAWEAA